MKNFNPKNYSSLDKEITDFYTTLDGIKFPKNKLSLLVSKPGIGKSYIILRFLMEMANKNIKSLYLTPEDEDGDIKERMKDILELSKDFIENNIINNVYIDNETDSLSYEVDSTNIMLSELGEEIVKFVKDNNIKILVLDPLDYFSEFPEKENIKAIAFLKLLKKVFIKKLNMTVILVHHLAKIKNKNFEDIDIDDVRGASSIASKVRYVIGLFNRKNNPDSLFLKPLKSNIKLDKEEIEIKILSKKEKRKQTFF